MSSAMDGHNLVFIVGSPRSGTTFLQRLLAALPGVKTGQESHLFPLVGPVFTGWRSQVRAVIKDTRGGVGLPCYFNEEEFLSIFREFLFRLLQPMVEGLRNDEVFVEKTPSHALYINTINELLPKAHIIHILRDPRDVVASLLRASRSWGKYFAPGRTIDAALIWLKHVNSVRRVARHLPSSLFYEIRYEDLVAAPVKSLLELNTFLGLNCSPSTVEIAVRDNRFEVARATGGTEIPLGGLVAKFNGPVVREPNGFFREGRSGGWKASLTLVEKYYVWRIAGSTMKEIGYGWTFPW